MSKKTRVIAFAVFFGVFLASYMIGTTYKMSDEESGKFLNDFQNETQGIDAIGIFFHNSSVSLPMFVPAFGVAWGSFTGWQTGAAFNAVASSNPALSNLSPLAPLLESPFGILEIAAYSIGMSRSFLLVWKIVKRNPLKKLIMPSAIEVGIVVLLLLIGGFVESSIISQQTALSSG
ncbi:Stage II sporulation protein M [uncultured archaeon]|nr:Stage II sporulation protein M [uncultured archaeon]